MQPDSIKASSVLAAYNPDDHVNLRSKLHCPFDRCTEAISIVYTNEVEMLDCCLCILFSDI